MKVFKFGGASVKDAEGVKNIARVLEYENATSGLVVVSAMGKMTNAFEAIVKAYCNDKELTSEIKSVKEYHYNILQDLFDEKDQIFEVVETLFTDLYSFLQSNQNKQYDYVYDQVVCYGELLSTRIVSSYFNKLKLKNEWLDVRDLIKTDNSYRDAKVDWITTDEAINKSIKKDQLQIVQGFLGGASDGIGTTLGREGSDYTAGIFAYCLDAESVTIWKDVNGVYNGDPRKFENTIQLEEISYEETIEMAFYGASVIHPKTIQPLQSKEIPLYVRSFNNLNLKGTKVSRGVSLMPHTSCFIVKENQILVSISALDFSFMVEDNISHIFKLLHQYQLKVNMIQNSAISFSVCVDNKFNQFNEFYKEIQTNYKVEFIDDVDLYTVRHFNDSSINMIQQKGEVVLTQIVKETAQLIIKTKE